MAANRFLNKKFLGLLGLVIMLTAAFLWYIGSKGMSEEGQRTEIKIPVDHSVAVVACKGEKYGLLDVNGEKILPFQFDDYETDDYSKKRTTPEKYIAFEKDGKWGLYTHEGKRVVEHRYKSITIRYPGALCSAEPGDTGAVFPFDTRSLIKLPDELQVAIDIRQGFEGGCKYFWAKDGIMFFLDNDLSVLKKLPKEGHSASFSEWFVNYFERNTSFKPIKKIVQVYSPDMQLMLESECLDFDTWKWGDRQMLFGYQPRPGEENNELGWERGSFVWQRMLADEMENEKNLLWMEKDAGHWEVYDRDCNRIRDVECEELDYIGRGFFKVVRQGKTELTNFDGISRVLEGESNLLYFVAGLLVVGNQDGVNYLDKQLNFVSETPFQTASPHFWLGKEYAEVSRDGKFYLSDRELKPYRQLACRQIYTHYDYLDRVLLETDDRYILVGKGGDVICEALRKENDELLPYRSVSCNGIVVNRADGSLYVCNSEKQRVFNGVTALNTLADSKAVRTSEFAHYIDVHFWLEWGHSLELFPVSGKNEKLGVASISRGIVVSPNYDGIYISD